MFSIYKAQLFYSTRSLRAILFMSLRSLSLSLSLSLPLFLFFSFTRSFIHTHVRAPTSIHNSEFKNLSGTDTYIWPFLDMIESNNIKLHFKEIKLRICFFYSNFGTSSELNFLENKVYEKKFILHFSLIFID